MKYTKKTFRTFLEYEIKQKTLAVKQSQKFGLDYECEIQLNALVLPHGVSYSRSEYHFVPLATVGFFIFLGSLLFLSQPIPVTENTYFIVQCTIGVGCIIGSCFTGKKLKTVFYYNTENSYIIGITENKNDREEFDIFIEALDQRIDKLKEPEQKSEA